MKPELKQKWIELLISGDFPQTIGYLHRIEPSKIPEHTLGYCCLGVLCVAAGQEEVTPEVGGENYFIDKEGNKQFGFLSDASKREFGLSLEQTHKLMHKNDNGYSFKEIAAWIKENIK